MKALLISGILMVGVSMQAFSMGHPHNMFAARKQLRAKTSASVEKSKLSSSSCWQSQSVIQLTKTAFSGQLVSTLSQMRTARSY